MKPASNKKRKRRFGVVRSMYHNKLLGAKSVGKESVVSKRISRFPCAPCKRWKALVLKPSLHKWAFQFRFLLGAGEIKGMFLSLKDLRGGGGFTFPRHRLSSR